MKINTPIRIAIFLGIIISIFSFLLFYGSQNKINIVYLLILLGCFSTLLIYYVVKKSFHEKIKVIYKNIYKFRGTSNIIDLDIDDVEKQAEEWADAKEQELKEMQQDANYRREFLGNVSHELKTPIFNIQGYIQTLIDGGLEDDEINMRYLTIKIYI